MTFLLAIWKFLKAIPWPVWLFLAVLLACWQWGNMRYKTGVTVTEAKHAKALKEAEDKAQAITDVLLGKVYDISYSAEVRRRTRETDYQATLAGLDTGAIVMQPRLRCKAVSNDPGATSVDNDASSGGLLPEDLRAILSEANRADDYTERLQSCQAYVQAVREAVNE